MDPTPGGVLGGEQKARRAASDRHAAPPVGSSLTVGVSRLAERSG